MKRTIFLLLILIYNFSFSQNINAEKLNNYLKYIENKNLGIGSLSIFKNGKEVYSKNFGQKNIPGMYFNGNTKYQVGSVTKMITATLIFKLIEENKLHLEDKLSDFYPEIPNSNKITIKNMLEHTSGLGSYVVKDGEVWVTKKVSDQEIMNLIMKQGVSFEPNEKVSYSNTAYYLLTKILEKKRKKPFHTILETEITTPLGLKNLQSVQSNPKNIFQPYRYENNSWNLLKEEINFFNVIGVGDIAATPQNLNIFMNQLFHHKILKKSSLDQMMPTSGKEDWGRGIAVWDFDGIIYYGHGGDTLGSHALVIYNKEADISIAYTTNGERIKKEDFIKNIVYLLYNKDVKLPEAIN